MDDCYCVPPSLNLDPHRGNASAYRRVLWAVLAINAVMFLVEIGAGLVAGSVSLQADALDFFGDAANYAISLMVVGMALRYRATAALAKGATMGLFGLWVIGAVVWHAVHGTLPSAFTMGTHSRPRIGRPPAEWLQRNLASRKNRDKQRGSRAQATEKSTASL